MSLQDELSKLKGKYSDDLTKDEALELALEAAQLHIKFLTLVKDQNEKENIRKNCNEILEQAERIKSAESWKPSDHVLLNFHADVLDRSLAKNANPPRIKLSPPPSNSRRIPPSEEILLLQGSKLHGFKFPPWKVAPNDRDFDISESQGLFVDEPDIRMSDDQLTILSGWKRPSDALPPPSWSLNDSYAKLCEAASPSMKIINKVDFVQDAATDCSVVASLAAGTARAQKGHAKLLSTIIYPYDVENDCPRMSPNGKYVLRLNFNGCARKVVIDDRIPVSKSPRVLHVVDRSNPGLLWPALLEKGYLKVRGGYDFPGSNSGTDLWILSGWIPEQVFLQHDETNVSHLWARIFKAFGYGDVIITLGTGKMSPQAEADSGLAGAHDYAVLDMKHHSERRFLLIKNPWLKGTSWKNHRIYATAANNLGDDNCIGDEVTQYPAPTQPLDISSQLTASTVTGNTTLSPGTFWMEMSDVMQYFESVFLNWNPGLFKFRQDIHFTWDLRPSGSGLGPPGSFTRNPQHVIVCDEGGILWLVLAKHFKDKAGESQFEPTNGDDGYISLYAFADNGRRVNLSKGAIKQGFYVDSPQVLLQLDLPKKSSYTIVTSGEELSNTLHTFTLSAFSNSPFTINSALSRYTTQTKHNSSWVQDSAGGNSNSATYSHNPQFSLVLPSRTAISLVLETLMPNVSVHVKLLHGYGQRVFNITAKDIIVDSGNYRPGCAQARIEDLEAGVYTIICSTFEPGQQGDFTLLVESLTKHTVKRIPREGAGRIRTRFADASFGIGGRFLAAPLVPLRLSRINFTARYITPIASLSGMEGRGSSEAGEILSVHSPTRLTVELGRGPDRKILTASSGGSFSDSASGLRTEDVDLSPEMTKKTDMWLVLERLGGFESMDRVEERIAVDMWADAGSVLDVGVWREWER